MLATDRQGLQVANVARPKRQGRQGDHILAACEGISLANGSRRTSDAVAQRRPYEVWLARNGRGDGATAWSLLNRNLFHEVRLLGASGPTSQGLPRARATFWWARGNRLDFLWPNGPPDRPRGSSGVWQPLAHWAAPRALQVPFSRDVALTLGERRPFRQVLATRPQNG